MIQRHLELHRDPVMVSIDAGETLSMGHRNEATYKGEMMEFLSLEISTERQIR